LGPILIAVFLFVLVLTVVVPRINELFLLSVRRGELLVVRGRVPAGVKRDFTEVVKSAGIETATIRAVKTSTHARLLVRGVDESTAQRLRNTFGIHTVSKLQSAQPTREQRNFGQRLGWIWLSWFLFSRRR
jgi:hypothetical protein